MGVQKRRAGQPGKQRRVFDGIPCPIAAPAQLHVRPLGAQRMPTPRKTQEISAHGRASIAQAASVRRMASAPINRAKGIVKPA